MKKIVALVLAMVMVLGLATVASAATTTTYNDKDVVMTTPAGVSTEHADYDFVKYEKSTNTTTVDGKTVVTVTPVYFESSFASKKMVVVDKTLADYILKIEDVGTFYIAEMTDVPVVNAADVATVYVAPEEAACGVVGAGYATFYVVDGKYYAADAAGTKTALVGGEYVRMAATNTLPTAHDWTNATVKVWDSEDYATAKTVKCPECEALIDVYTVPGSFDGKTYVQIPAGVAAGYYYVAGASASAGADAPAAGDKVESAETFDAGIAMYVGMSVMAAAGSAVVLKKKD